jgi:HEAT repeat protein
MKAKIKQMLQIEPDAAIRFEVLERFVDHVNCEEDVRLIVSLLESDSDPCVRHEAAAQLYRIEETKPHLMNGVREHAVATLLDKALTDESTVVRHESIEVLGYIGDRDALPHLAELAKNNNLDIRSTAEIAYRTAHRRLTDDITTSGLSAHLIKHWSGGPYLKREK